MKVLKVFAVIALILCSVFAAAQDDGVVINYQGRVKVKGQPFEGTGYFKFAIYSKHGANEYCLWVNDGFTTQSAPANPVAVEVLNGYFRVIIGDDTIPNMLPLDPVIFNTKDPLFLRTWFSDGENMFEILMPAHRITNADLLGQKQVRPITLYVNSEVGDDSWTGMHPGRPKKTIQSAVDALPAIITFPVRIQVAPGMYPEQVLIKNRHVNAPTANIHIISEKNESAIHPRAIVTGKDNETSPPVRNNGFLLDNVSDIILEGFGVESTTCEGIFINKGQIEINDFRVTESLTNAGIKCVEFSNLVLRNTSITKSVSGVSAVTQSTVKAYDCIIEDMSPYHGFSGTGGSTLALYNCSISNCHGSGAIAFYMATISLFDCNISNCGKGNYFWGFECWDNSFGKLYATKISNCVTGGVKASRSGYIQFRPHPDTSKKCEVINNPVGLRAEMLSAIENFEGISLILNNTINISSNQNGYFYYIP